MPLHQQAESACFGRSFRHQHQAARFPIEAIHDRNLAAGGNLECEQFTQFAPKIWRAVWLCGVNKKKWRLIDDSVVVGFIDDIEME
jgi:hypothetical protein